MRRVLAAVALTLALLPRPAVAAATAEERKMIAVVLEIAFPGVDVSSTAKCVSKTMPAGEISKMFDDLSGALISNRPDVKFFQSNATDPSAEVLVALQNSIGFRALMRRVFLCQPPGMVSELAATIKGVAGVSTSQAKCISRNYLTYVANNDQMLTLLIRSLTAPDDEPDPAPEVTAAAYAAATKPCVPRSSYKRVVDALSSAAI